MHKSIHIFWNPSAGSSDKYSELKAQLSQRTDTVIHELTKELKIDQVLQQNKNDIKTVVAAGGDGTVNAVVSEILKLKLSVEFAILPLGTGNDFSRSLNIPTDAAQAVTVLDQGHILDTDVMQLESVQGTRYAVNMITGGNTGEYMQALKDEDKKIWGPFTYLKGILNVLGNLQRYKLTISVNEQPTQEITLLNLFLANGKTSGAGMTVAQDASLSDGQIDMVLIKDCTAAEIAEFTTSYFIDDYRKHPKIITGKFTRIEIHSPSEFIFSADGELLQTDYLRVEILPGVLHVRVPNI